MSPCVVYIGNIAHHFVSNLFIIGLWIQVWGEGALNFFELILSLKWGLVRWFLSWSEVFGIKIFLVTAGEATLLVSILLKWLNWQMTLKQYNMILEKQNCYFKGILHDFEKKMQNFCFQFCEGFKLANDINAIQHDFEKAFFFLLESNITWLKCFKFFEGIKLANDIKAT